MAALEPDSETTPESELNSPSMPKHSMPVGILPLIPTSVTVCDVMWNIPMAGLLVELLARHAIPPDSLTRHAALMTWTVIEVIIGRVPTKPEYLTCQGSVALRIVAVPSAHGPSAAFVM